MVKERLGYSEEELALSKSDRRNAKAMAAAPEITRWPSSAPAASMSPSRVAAGGTRSSRPGSRTATRWPQAGAGERPKRGAALGARPSGRGPTPGLIGCRTR